MDKASDYESGDSRFESWRGRLFFLKETKKIRVQIIKVNNLQIIKVWSNGHKQRKKVFFIQVLNKSSQRIGWSNGQVKKMFCWMWIWKSALRKEHRIFFSFSELPPFALIRDFAKQNTRGNVSKTSVSLVCYWESRSKSTYYSHQCNLLTFSTSCYRAVIGRFRSDLSITRKTDVNFGNVSACVLFSKVLCVAPWPNG